MLCPKCSKEIPPAFTFCPFCAQAAISGDPLSATAAMPPLPPPAKEAPLTLKILAVAGGLVCVLIVVLMSLVLTRRTHLTMNPEAIGFAIGTCIGAFLFPIIGVLLYAKFNKKKHVPAYLFGAICGFALLFSFFGIVPQFAKPSVSSPDEIHKRLATLAKEATGQKPVGKNQDEYDDILRGFFADIKKFNDDYHAEIAAADNSALKSLYTASSFSNDANISKTIEQLQAVRDLDEKHASMEPIIQKTKERLFASSMSESAKQEFWNGFESSLQKSLQPREEVNAKEHAWLTDSINLYQFMQANEKSFHVKNNKVLFTGDSLLSAFNEKIGKADAERKDFLAAQEKFHKAQQEGLGKLGLKPSDFDAPNGKPNEAQQTPR
jgi:hypothetical protein